jgi:hypothetical protein
MAPPANNLFHRLHKWASRQDENFLTETLAVVLEQLLELAPSVGVRMVSRLTGGFIDRPPEEASAIEVSTQVEAGSGRPDLEFRTPYRVAWLEVKAESVLRVGQLEGYRVLLAESGVAETRLILLTRYPETFTSDAARPDLELRWFEVADGFEDELPAAVAAGEVAVFLVRQFLDFLEVRRMTLAHVGKFMPEGLRAMSNLMNMLVEAAAACKVTAKRTWTKEYIGLNLSGGYWIGVDFSEPETLWFSTWERINSEAGVRLGVGEVFQDSRAPGGYRWRRKLELESETVHFFVRSKVSQMECLESFLRECLTQARSIETADQPPIAEEPAKGSDA